MESPFAAWMDRLTLDRPDSTPTKDTPDPLLTTLTEKGYAHEAQIEAELASQGYRITRIEGASNEEKLAQTLAAMREGADVITQGRLELPPLAGYADFLVKVPGASQLGDYHYEVWDAKLANSAKPTFVIQLCCYAEMLDAMQGGLPQTITLALGTGERQALRTADYYAYYQSLKNTYLTEQENFDPDQPPDPADSKSWGDWSGHAEQLLLSRDHLFQVANISRGQIKKLNQSGITTMTALAQSKLDRVPGINPLILARLKDQAAIQTTSVSGDTPAFRILTHPPGEKNGLALLPPSSPLDVFFDIEGYPLMEGGLEYLWGSTYYNETGKRDFKDFWAHDHAQEKATFEAFMRWVYARWQADPNMHIYHYANYEVTACRKLMGRYGVCEHEVDQLLRNEVFVDLYKVVRGGLLLGEPRYSIKNVELLYRPKRNTDVASGGESVVVYEQWRTLNQLGEQGDTWQTSDILKGIREYNIDDCDSTEELTRWLREQQQTHGITFIGKTEVEEPELTEEVTARTQLRDRLLARAEAERTADPAQASLTENLAWALEFHRRENKPTFWRLFDRLGLSETELEDDLDCLAGCTRTDREAFKPTPRARNLAYEYSFDPAQEFKGAQKQFYLLGIEDEDGKRAQVSYKEEHSDLERGLIVLQAKDEPPGTVTLVPDEFVRPDPIPQAINDIVAEYEQDKLTATNNAIIDFLTRARPRITGHDGGAIVTAIKSDERLAQIIRAVKNLDHSYLPIQGPPGAGKTYTGKHVIAELVKDGARVGVASNSHKAINNLLLSTAAYCTEKNIAASIVCTKDTEPALLQAGVTIASNNQLANLVQPGCVLGTTAWGFAREDMVEQLDYLFIDEAGQVSVANLIAMSRAARNLVLMGDQMQLGQPSQGTHPAESGLSILDYLLHETPTIDDTMGVFLDTTYRMHSRVNQFISDHIYDGKLKAFPDNDTRIITVPNTYSGVLTKEAGIIFVPVNHEGNTQASDEEVAQIVELSDALLGRTFHTGQPAQKTRPIDWQDILFVAPYNHQVNKLKNALGDNALVGSVDKFQGQEAPIVILSMCASDSSESPRGLDFLLDKHRINVAISRAQTLAIVVGNPKLGQTNPGSIEQTALLNLFSGIVAEGGI